MKITTHDILRIMRLFKRADEQNIPKDTTQLIVKHPGSTNTMGTFLHKGKSYALLFDDTITDDLDLLKDEIQKIHPNAEVELVVNPLTEGVAHGMPYQGKNCYLATLNDHLMRLDAFIAQRHTSYSRSSWQQFIRQGYITVNGVVAEKPKQQVGPEDTIVIDLPEKESYSDQELPIIYQDDDILVIDKPAGVLTHAKNERDDEFTVESFITRFIDDTLGPEERHGIVHRLDRDTSGLIVCALNKPSYEHLKAQFAGRLVQKTYYAITAGIPSEQKAIIDIPILRSTTVPGTFVANLKGKPAETLYEVIEHHAGKALVQLQPKTGRTHQLRVHLTHLGTPIIGDRLYGSAKTAAPRMYLHAAGLEFASSEDDSTYEFESPLPEEFMQELRKDD